MTRVVKVYTEKLPDVKLIGRKYAEKDRGPELTFSAKWAEWFADGNMEKLKSCHGIEKVSDDLIGAIRCTGNGFEYWIGAFMAMDDIVPDGMDSVEITGGDMAVVWLYGRDNSPEIFGMEASNACMAEWAKQGLNISGSNWFFERYNCPRYTSPDENGNVILDYCALL